MSETQQLPENATVIDWDDLKKAVLASFKSKEIREEYERQLNSRKLKTGESIENYYWEILCLCEKIDRKMPEDVKVSHLLRGLHPKIAKDIYLKNPTTADDVYKQLVSFERFEYLMGHHFNISTLEMAPLVPDNFVNAVVNKLQKLNINKNNNNPKGLKPKALQVIIDLRRFIINNYNCEVSTSYERNPTVGIERDGLNSSAIMNSM